MKNKLILWLVLLLGLCAAAVPATQAISLNIEIGDRPYYSHGPGYWNHGVYYVWVPGHWRVRYHHRVWIHGHYIVREHHHHHHY